MAPWFPRRDETKIGLITAVRALSELLLDRRVGDTCELDPSLEIDIALEDTSRCTGALYDLMTAR